MCLLPVSLITICRFVLRTLNNTCAGEGESGPGGEDYAFLAGQFRLPDNRTALLLQNQDWADSLWASVSWSVPLERVVEVDPSSGEELALMDDSPALVGLQLGVVAGGARLFIVD